MAETLKQVETVTTYPDAPGGLSVKAAAIDANMIWARIEAYTAHRFTERAVVWTVEGEGEWAPPLTPATLATVEVFEAGAWNSTTAPENAFGGYDFPGDGPYRITGTAGAGPVPAPVAEAFRRLAEYLSGARDSTDEPGASSSKFSIGGTVDFEVTRNPAWVARAMQYSGAGDLLRNYRRA